MDRRLALVTLWAAFAVAAVGVGFGAAGLVGGPFSDGVADAAGSGLNQQPAATSTAGSPASSSSPTASGSSSPTATKGPGPAATGKPARTGGASGPSAHVAPARSVTRSITTRGGLVSATCRSGLVQVSGSPAVGWEIADIDGGAQRDARVRFERPDGDGRVEVAAGCSGGAPRFSLDDDDGGGDDGGGDDGEGDDGEGDDDSSSGGAERDGDEDRD